MGHPRGHEECQEHQWKLNREIKKFEKDVAFLEIFSLQPQESNEPAEEPVDSIGVPAKESNGFDFVSEDQLTVGLQHLMALIQQAVNLVVGHLAEGWNADDLIERLRLEFVLHLQGMK